MSSYATIQVDATPTGFGARITGLNLSEPMPAEQLAEVKHAWAQHGVVCFPDQPLTHEQLEAYTLQIGDFGHDPFIKPLADHPHILELRRNADETTKNFGAAWHSDWSFQPQPPAATILHAKVTPPVGGDTLFADCCRAYESLSPTMQRFLDGLTAIHTAAKPYGRQSRYATEDASRRAMQIIVSEEAEKTWPHPLVRTHPVPPAGLFVPPRHTGRVRLPPEVAAQHADHVGQPLHPAQRRGRLRRPPARDAPHHGGGRNAGLSEGWPRGGPTLAATACLIAGAQTGRELLRVTVKSVWSMHGPPLGKWT